MTVSGAVRELLRLFPDCEVGCDNDGQLVIYTGCRVQEGDLVPFKPEEVRDVP